MNNILLFALLLLITGCSSLKPALLERDFHRAVDEATTRFDFAKDNCCQVAQYLHDTLQKAGHTVVYVFVTLDGVGHAVVCEYEKGRYKADNLLCVDNGASMAGRSHLFTYGELKAVSGLILYNAGKCKEPTL